MTRESQSRREARGEVGSRRGTTRVTLRLDDCAATESTTARLPMVSHLAFGYPSRSRDVYPCPHSPRAECANFSSSLISRLLTCFALDPAAAARASQQIELHTAAGTRHRASASAASPSAHLTFDCGLFTFGRGAQVSSGHFRSSRVTSRHVTCHVKSSRVESSRVKSRVQLSQDKSRARVKSQAKPSQARPGQVRKADSSPLAVPGRGASPSADPSSSPRRRFCLCSTNSPSVPSSSVAAAAAPIPPSGGNPFLVPPSPTVARTLAEAFSSSAN